MATITAAATYPINAQQYAVDQSVAAPTTPYSGTFIPSFWSGKLAKKFYDTTIFGAITNTDWAGEIKNVGDEVVINTIPTISVKDYKVGQHLEYEVPTGKTFTMKVDQGEYFGVNVNDVMEYQSKIPLMNTFCDDAAQQMKLRVDAKGLHKTFFGTVDGATLATNDDGYGAIYEANCGANAGAHTGAFNLGTDAAPVTVTKDNIIQCITALSTVLDEANVPEDGRFLVLSPYERYLLMSSPLAQAYVTGDSQSILRNGKIGRIDRFAIYVTNVLPTAKASEGWNGEAGEGVKRHLIFAGQKSAISFCSQISKVEKLQNPTDFGQLVRGLNIWGSQVTMGKCLAPMIVAN